jgi:translation initiation factor eIF-2B subunit delta
MRLALQFGRRRILGSTERCQAMLRTFRRVIEQDYHAPPSSHPSHGQPSQPSHAIHHSLAINRHMDQWLRPQIAYLVQARPLSVSMGHAIRALKLRISQLAPDVSEEDAKRAVIDAIDAFQRERFTVPRDLIVHFGVQKVKPQDVIVTFAR